jgi:UDP-N-acetylglucosamine diphosphorylase / glucose-1-phosphate thymidylyltransferase / UDP-N-acetylgalactosamine diphosphorylase / glucosamine-1-phosphate N-acetyltransferase / galactosamine-1-phosphate N-acetyltransferase
LINIKQILLFEPEWAEQFYPFSILHSTWEIRCGALRLFEKVKHKFPNEKLFFHGRENHLNSFNARFNIKTEKINEENLLVLNSAVLTNHEFWDKIEQTIEDIRIKRGTESSLIFTHNSNALAAFICKDDLITNHTQKVYESISDLESVNFSSYQKVEISDVIMLNYLWDAIEYNSKAIIDDESYFSKNYSNFEGNKFYGVFGLNKDKIYIGDNTKIAPGVVLDANGGPIIIGNNVNIMPNATIIGPCFIGDNSTIKIGAKIYHNTSIGEWCKIGGEVEDSLIHAYSNKQHDGFLGHSYLCEWVNLGADTNTSDLKNTYSEITVQLEDKTIGTNRIFLGLLCGDHTKSAINTSFTTGTTAGICGIIVADGFLPNSIPSFAWRGTKGCSKYHVDKAMDVARIVMARRGKELLQEEEKLIRFEYNKIASITI